MTAATPQTTGLPPGADEGPPSLSSQLHGVQLGVREDLDVTRHLFRGEPSYIIRDPVTFQSQRLTPADYDVFSSLDPSRSLGDIFEDLVKKEKAQREDEEEFYRYVMSLHRIGFLQLPISSDKMLYRRHQMKVRARNQERVMSILFLKIPLVNPDAFLNRTIGRVSWIFSPHFFVLWSAMMLAAGFIVLKRWSEITEPIQGLLATQNLVLMWVTLIGLKVFHELGHAYCCKHFGGHVPEMGAFMILFTPCAYVDATASWGFTRKRHRLYVCLAGMYFECILACIAIFIWALSGPGLLKSACYNVIFLATVVTILFNINPLMRYDGYYVLSDLVEIPNLRSRSTNYVIALLKRIVFAVRSNAGHSPAEHCILLGYGVAAAIYKVVLVLTISAVIASKVFLVGVLMAVFYVGSTVFKTLCSMTEYLWQAEETAHARIRAISISVITLLFAPLAVFLVPVPASVVAGAVVIAENESVTHVREPGFVQALWLRNGQKATAGMPLLQLENHVYDEQVATATSLVSAAETRLDAFRVIRPAFVEQETAQLSLSLRELSMAQESRDRLTIHSPSDGRVVECLEPEDVGRFLEPGTPVATVISGRYQVIAVLNEQQMAAVQPQAGDIVAFRSLASPGTSIEGIVERVFPSGSRTIDLESLTHIAGGTIAVNPDDGTAAEPYFEILINLDRFASDELLYGMTGAVQLEAQPTPLGVRATHRLVRFANRLLRE
ncbi:MAG: efflux RND transporter periplasmic adaptor subunit [Phycisphaerae bacterium]